MSSYLIDTNVVSEYGRRKPSRAVVAWAESVDARTTFVSVLTFGEIRRGIAMLEFGAQRNRLERWFSDIRAAYRGRVLEVTAAIADRWGHLVAAQAMRGRNLPVIDALIAATALENNLTVVTRNTRDFEAAGVPVLNPWE